MMGEIGVGGENFENNGVKMGKWFVDYDSQEEKEEVLKRIEGVR